MCRFSLFVEKNLLSSNLKKKITLTLEEEFLINLNIHKKNINI